MSFDDVSRFAPRFDAGVPLGGQQPLGDAPPGFGSAVNGLVPNPQMGNAERDFLEVQKQQATLMGAAVARDARTVEQFEISAMRAKNLKQYRIKRAVFFGLLTLWILFVIIRRFYGWLLFNPMLGVGELVVVSVLTALVSVYYLRKIKAQHLGVDSRLQLYADTPVGGQRHDAFTQKVPPVRRW